TTVAQGLVKETEGAVLQRLVEIDQNVATGNQLRLGKYAVGRQAVVGEGDVVLQRLVHDRRVVSSGVIVREAALVADSLVVLGVLLQIVNAEDALPGLLQRARIDIDCVEDRKLL